MKTRQIILVILFLFSFNFCDSTDPNPPTNNPPGYQEDIPWPSLADSPWPMNQHDPQNTGRSKYSGPALGNILWSFDPNYIQGSASIGNDSTIYIPESGGLFALNSSGEVRWNYKINSQIIMAPLVASDGSIYFANYLNDPYLIALNPDGTLKWEVDLGKFVGPNMINIDITGRLYVVAGGTLFCISQDGTIVWELTDLRFNSDGGNGITFSPDGTSLYIPGIVSSLFAVDIVSRKINWIFGSETLSSAPMVDSQGNIYLIPMSRSKTDSISYLYSISSEGNIRWKYQFVYPPSTGLVLKSPTIDPSGNIYFATDSLYSVSYQGELNWVKPLTGICDCPLVSDNNSNIYVATQSGIDKKVFLYCFDSKGIMKWNLDFDHFQVGPAPTITKERGLIFSPWRSFKTYYIK